MASFRPNQWLATRTPAQTAKVMTIVIKTPDGTAMPLITATAAVTGGTMMIAHQAKSLSKTLGPPKATTDASRLAMNALSQTSGNRCQMLVRPTMSEATQPRSPAATIAVTTLSRVTPFMLNSPYTRIEQPTHGIQPKMTIQRKPRKSNYSETARNTSSSEVMPLDAL